MRAAIAAARRPATVLSAQDSIPFERMFPDGICRVEGKFYSKTIQFQDINYQLSQSEDKDAIFDGWCDFLNYFDASVRFQFSFVNSAANKETYRDRITIPLRGDEDDSLRAEYSRMLQDQLERGNNGLIKNKYLTFGIEAEGYKTAKPRLERLETDILNNFRKLGVKAEPLDGRARLALMHGIFHIDGQEPFKFSWDMLAPSGLSVKDFIAPSSFEFASSRHFKMGAKYGAVSFLNILAPELNDRLLADLLDMDSSLVVSMHVKALDQLNAIKTVKRKLTELNATKIQEQKKAVRSGYDMDILPSDLATYGTEAQKLLQELQSRNERMFLLTFVVVNTADSLKALNNTVLQAKGVAQKHNCQLVPLDFQQEDGLMSALPLALNRIEIQRGLTTSSLAIFVPFTTQELFQREPGAFYCGTNALSGNLIMVDRLKQKNPNGLILGVPGSGKSFAAKREMFSVYLLTNDDIMICDPEAEYWPLVKRLHGQVIKISPTSKQYVNPMDLSLDYSDDDNPLSLKVDFILSFCDIVVGSKEGLKPVEKTIIDRCVRLAVSGDGAGDLRHRQPERIQPPHQRGYTKPRRLLRHKGAGQAAKAARNVGCAGPGVEPRDAQPRGGQNYALLRRRVPPSAARRAGRVERGDMEALQEMGRCADRRHAKCERPAGKPRGREHPRKLGLHLYAQSGPGRPADTCTEAQYLAAPAFVCDAG